MSQDSLYQLRCRECGKTWGNVPRSFCEDCFSPLEVAYDYDAVEKIARRENLSRRAFNMWRYSELLPLTEDFAARTAIGVPPMAVHVALFRAAAADRGFRRTNGHRRDAARSLTEARSAMGLEESLSEK